MGDRNDMSSFEVTMMEMFRRLGLPDPLVVGRIKDEWDSLAGTPWLGRSKPVTIQGKTLVVEANSPSLVAFLRYSSDDLLRSLEKRFGPGVIATIEVKGPQ
jgi:Dna[CI] antecedent, DciA